MIELKNLCKNFGSKAALHDVSLTVEGGHIVGLVGSNGAGKSTLLRAVAGIYTPDAGEIYIDEVNAAESPEARAAVMFVPDNQHYEAGATLASVVRELRAFYPQFSKEKYEKLLKIFPIQPKQRINSMSKGMQRQACLIAALSVMPRYLLLDEVFDGLDPVMRRLLKRVIANEVAERGMAVLIASHNLRELEDFCDTVGLLHSGGILLEKEVDSLGLELHRVQAAFEKTLDYETLYNHLELVSLSRSGSMCTFVTRGDRASVEAELDALGATFYEFLPLSLEEVFISEMEAVGYDFENILQ